VHVASGGLGGFGNPYFLSSTNWSLKFATHWRDGHCIALKIQLLKLVADVGIVGFLNERKELAAVLNEG